VRKNCVSRDIPAPGNPVSTGSIAIGISRNGHLGVTAAIAFVSLSLKTLRPKQEWVNTKPPPKSFVMAREPTRDFPVCKAA
jgi:hypothetical protein